jgi:hypothetical protein
MAQSWCCVVGPRGIKRPCIWSAIWQQLRRRVAGIKSASASRLFSQTRKAEVSIFIRRIYQTHSVSLGYESQRVERISGLSIEAHYVKKKDGESSFIVGSAVIEASSSWD